MKRGSLTVRIEGEWDVTRLNPEMSRVFCQRLLEQMFEGILQKQQRKGDSGDVASITCEDKIQIAN